MNRKRYGDPWDFRYKLSQISRVMKMVFFMMLLSLTHLSASVKSQNSVVNLTLKNVSVEQALTKVEKQLKQNFFFNRENVDLERKVDLQLSDADLDELVLQLFGRDYKYRVVDNIIVVSRKDEEQEQPQQIKVEGVVKDKRGDALPGVTVLIKGTKIGWLRIWTENIPFRFRLVPRYWYSLWWVCRIRRRRSVNAPGSMSYWKRR